MSQVLYGVISFCKIMLGFLIFVRIFPEKRWKQKWVGILGWGILVICAVENAWDSCHGFIPWLQIIIYGIVNAVVIKLFYQSSFLDAWLWNWLYDIGYSLLKIPFIIARGLYLDKGVAYLNVSGGRVLPECILCLFQLGIIVFIYFKCLERVEFLLRQLTKNKKVKCLFLPIEIVILIVIELMIELGNFKYNTKDIAVGLLFAFAMITVFLLYMIYTMYTYSRMEQKNLHIQKEILARENEIITQYCRQDAKRLHDLKHTWIYLQECLEENRLGNAKECVHKHLEEVKQQERHTWTGISEIDAILNYKHQQMEKYGIQFSSDIELYTLPITGEDFMIIWGNVLDNAIEAARKCEAEERKIHLLIKNVNEMFMLRIRNTCLHKPKRDKNWFVTTKKDPIYHGWGTANVKQIVESAGGEIEYTCERNWFEVNILI